MHIAHDAHNFWIYQIESSHIARPAFDKVKKKMVWPSLQIHTHLLHKIRHQGIQHHSAALR